VHLVVEVAEERPEKEEEIEDLTEKTCGENLAPLLLLFSSYSNFDLFESRLFQMYVDSEDKYLGVGGMSHPEAASIHPYTKKE
jgi:hypothetical protein